MAQKNKNKVYKLHLKKVMEIIQDFGFLPQQVVFDKGQGASKVEVQDEILIRTVELDRNSRAVQLLIDIFNNQEWQARLDKTGEEELAKGGITFKEIRNIDTNETRREVEISDASWTDLCEWQLCIEGRDMLLFLTKKDLPYSYYNANILDEMVGAIVQELLSEKIIRKVNAPKQDGKPIRTRAA